MRRPAFQFYPSDWRRDNELRVCSIGARGLWIEMMAIMHDGTPYGHLAVAGCPVTTPQLASLVGVTTSVCARLLAELEAHHVFSRTDSGVIYSRRMVHDEALREKRAGYGTLSLKNPAVPRPKDTPPDTRKDGGKDTLPPSFGGSPAVAVAVASAVASATAPATATTELPLQQLARTRKPRESGARQTWLTPAADAYTAVNGPGSFDFGKAARWLRPLVDAGHSPEKIGEHLAFYLDMRGDEMGYTKPPAKRGLSNWAPNLKVFRETFEKWNPHGVGEVAA